VANCRFAVSRLKTAEIRIMRKIILSILIVSTFCFSTYKTFAQCSCIPKLTLKEHFQPSDAVFVGKVIEAKKILQENINDYDIVIKFEVKQTWKQDLERFVTVKELSSSTGGFEPNTEWLLYAFKEKDGTFRIIRSCCSRTKLLSVANKQGDLRAFKKMGMKSKKIIENNRKSENS
jgi:hypothetical protein